ncbi:MAG: ParB N-terminal domain-containing protein [Isosphaeraceae bacterium]
MTVETAPEMKSRTSPTFDVDWLPTASLKPSPENRLIYRPVRPDDPDVVVLAESIRDHGILDPLVVTADRYVVSGHRRLAAAGLLGLTYAPCRILADVRRDSCEEGEYLRILAAHNKQRVKTLDEIAREDCLEVDADDAYEELLNHRHRRAGLAGNLDAIDLGSKGRRKAISAAKMPMLRSAIHWLNRNRGIWPVSDRKVHYWLLNDPPLRHARKPESRYRNDLRSYKDLTDLLTRARIAGLIPFEAIADATRPETTWQTHRHANHFVRDELAGFLAGYWRDYQQSQPAHVEIIGEKNTIAGEIEPVAREYGIPFMLGRGYSSLEPRHRLLDRFLESGRDGLVLLILSDFDPEGEDIARAFPRSLRDDFGVDENRIRAIKVGLNREQVDALNLPPLAKAKAGSARRKGFVGLHGENVWELEAVPTETLQGWLRSAIEGVLDMDAFLREKAREKQDALWLRKRREAVRTLLSNAGLGGERGDTE